jgi:hypothetical protein
MSHQAPKHQHLKHHQASSSTNPSSIATTFVEDVILVMLKQGKGRDSFVEKETNRVQTCFAVSFTANPLRR